jgi:uncharacterized repeat protein (TIGR02543 family)
VGLAAPATAAISNASISPATWAASEQAAATLTWTESASTTNNNAFNDTDPSLGGNFISVEVGWGWTLAGANPTGTAVSYAATWDGTNTYTCATIGVVFASAGFSNTTTGTQPTSGARCLVRRSSTYSGNPGQQVVLANIGSGDNFNFTGSASISVTFPAGKVTAPSSGPASDTWRIISLTSAQTTTVTTVVPGVDSAGNTVSLITIDFDGNGGTCTTSKVTGVSGSWGKAPNEKDCTRAGYLFTGWNTSANGKGIQIWPRGDINFTGDNRVYAQWFDPNATVYPPGAPTNVVATSMWNDVRINWDAPKYTGSYPITNYLVTTSPENKSCVTTLADKKLTQCTMHNLRPGVNYTFTVQALNGGGWGDRSVASNAASPYNLKITKYERKKGNLFQLFKSTLTISGVTPGYKAGATITPWIRVGDKAWDQLVKDKFKASEQGTFSWSRKFDRNLNGTPISVKFLDADGNSSNVIVAKGVS